MLRLHVETHVMHSETCKARNAARGHPQCIVGRVGQQATINALSIMQCVGKALSLRTENCSPAASRLAKPLPGAALILNMQSRAAE